MLRDEKRQKYLTKSQNFVIQYYKYIYKSYFSCDQTHLIMSHVNIKKVVSEKLKLKKI